MKTKNDTDSSKLSIMASYGLGKFNAEFLGQAFGVVVFKYYETEVQLAGWLTALALVIYSLYNAVNDPILGYLTQQTETRFTKRYGRRFPWIFIGALIWVFTFILIFFIPEPVLANQGLLFLWMVGSTCLFDTFYSLWDVNYQSIFPDKFRSEAVRTKAAGIATGVGIVGIALGFILPSIITTFGVPETYITNSILIAVVGFFVVFLLIPGVKESPEMITRYYEDRKKVKESSFFSSLKNAFRFRNFVAWVILYFFYQSAVNSMTASVQYVGDYIINGSTTIVFIGLLVGALLGIPLWLSISNRIQDKITNQRMMMISALIMALFALPMTSPLVNTSLTFTLFIFLFGLGFGGYWMIMTPALADVIDQIVIKTGVRNDGIFFGFRAFFGRLAFAVQAISFWLVHELTGFNAEAGASQSELAILGIHIHTALLPAIFLVIGVIIFWRINTLNAEIIKNDKQKLKELNL